MRAHVHTHAAKAHAHKCTDTDTCTHKNLIRYQTCTLCMHTHALYTALRLHSSLRQPRRLSLRLGEQPDKVVLGQHAADLWRVCAGRGTQGHVQKERQRVRSAVCSAHCSSGRAPFPLPGREQGARRVRGAGVSVAYPERRSEARRAGAPPRPRARRTWWEHQPTCAGGLMQTTGGTAGRAPRGSACNERTATARAASRCLPHMSRTALPLQRTGTASQRHEETWHNARPVYWRVTCSTRSTAGAPAELTRQGGAVPQGALHPLAERTGQWQRAARTAHAAAHSVSHRLLCPHAAPKPRACLSRSQTRVRRPASASARLCNRKTW